MNTELNEKLAKWARFRRVIAYEVDPNMPAHWERGRDEWFMEADFTYSLDRCVKWLVPELDSWLIESDVPYSPGLIFCMVKKGGNRASANSIIDTPQAQGNPALVFCKTIEKLIDMGAQ